MKKVSFLLLSFLSTLVMAAQDNESGKALFDQGMNYIKGIKKPFDPSKARELFWQSAARNYPASMNALGNLYLQGIGIIVNNDSAFYWYSRAADLGYSKGMLAVGKLYKAGIGTKQNFSKAADYFKKGRQLINLDCSNMLGYMYYKGLGVEQNYKKAFELFQESARYGRENAMYFLALCYRNGYGPPVNAELAKQWLTKAAENGEIQASHELYSEPLPENISVVSTELDHQISILMNYKEKFIAKTDNNYEGEFRGYIVYYDWSGKFVHEILPLNLQLSKKGGNYEGVWQEGDINPASISMRVFNDQFSFSPNDYYTRTNHYSNRTPETWQFNEAKLSLGFIEGSIWLSGNVQFYSDTRKEPGKPTQIILKKSIPVAEGFLIADMTLFPNPTSSQTTVQFKLPMTAEIQIVVTSENGSRVHVEAGKILPPGTYTYTLNLASLPGGLYNISLVTNGGVNVTKKLIRQ